MAPAWACFAMERDKVYVMRTESVGRASVSGSASSIPSMKEDMPVLTFAAEDVDPISAVLFRGAVLSGSVQLPFSGRYHRVALFDDAIDHDFVSVETFRPKAVKELSDCGGAGDNG